MGNEQSDQSEENAFQVIKQIPIANSPNAPIRSAVYAGKGDTQKVRTTLYETAKSYSFIKRKLHVQIWLNCFSTKSFGKCWSKAYIIIFFRQTNFFSAFPFPKRFEPRRYN